MARCENCGSRFVYPGPRGKSPASLESGDEAVTISHPGEEGRALKTAEENPEPGVTQQATAAVSRAGRSGCCPACGSTFYRHCRRTRVDRILLRARMAQCGVCGSRFPYPEHRRHKSSDSLKLSEERATALPLAEENDLSKMAEENPEPKIAEQITASDSSDRRIRRCPACGSTEYHRIHRSALERLQLRPRMAYCEKCGSRFPYPRHHNRPSGSLKLGEEAATGGDIAAEKTALGMAEGSSAPNEGKQDTVLWSRGIRRCPACGSTDYRRSRRTTLERVLLRPKMARCRKCRTRFPYPKS
jgi:hypothetical protein